MKKYIKLLLAITLFFFTRNSWAQSYMMTNGSVNACTGTFYDSGNSGTNYGNSENFTYTICSGTAQHVYADFTAFNTESGFDILYIYDGPTTSDPLIGSYSGTTGPGLVYSSIGSCLTFRFTSDAATNNAGWTATIGCGTPPLSTLSVLLTTTGANTLTIPCGVTTMTVECWGGGGGGGGDNSTLTTTGGGGGGGGYSSMTIPVTPSAVASYTVGAGGAGGPAGGNGGSGAASIFIYTPATATLTASGGGGAVGSTGSNGGGGLAGTANGGTTNTSGNAGGLGAANSSGIGGNSPNGSISGGSGGLSVTADGNGNNGTAPGGGGSGANHTSLTTNTGGIGGNGEIIIRYNNPSPIITSQNTSAQTVCQNAALAPLSVTATGGAPLSYQWYSNSSASTTGGTSISGATSATYTPSSSTVGVLYYYCIVSGCGPRPTYTSLVSGAITVNGLPLANGGVNPTVCSGSSASLNGSGSGGTPSYSYSWYTALTGGTLLASSTFYNTPGLTPGTYTYYFQVTDANSCVSSPRSSVIVTALPNPTMTSANTATICSGATLGLGLTATVASNYSWIAANNTNITGESTTSQSGATINNTLVNSSAVAQVVSYTVTPTSNPSGCVGTPQTVNVTVNPLPTATAMADHSVCQNSTDNLTSTASGGSGAGYVYNWFNVVTGGTSLGTGSTYVTPSLGTPGVFNYYSQVTDGNSCVSTRDLVQVTVIGRPSMTSAASSSMCSGLAMNQALTADIGGSTFDWYATDNVNVSGESLTLVSTSTMSNTLLSSNHSNNEIVTYYVYATNNGCVGPTQVYTLTVLPAPNPPSISSTVNVTCNGLNNGTVFLSAATGGTGPFNYSLNNVTYQLSTVFNSLAPGAYNAYSKDANSCVSNTSTAVTITQPAVLSGSAGTTNVTCVGGTNGTATITPSGGTSPYQYSLNGGAYVGSPIFTGLSAGSYTVNIKDNNNCVSGNITFNITQPGSAVSFSTGGTSSICSGAPLNISITPIGGTPGYTYSWSTSDNANTTGESTTSQSTATINNTITNSTINIESLTYTVTVTDAIGCTATSTVMATVYPKPTVTSLASGITCSNVSFSQVLNASVPSNFQWVATPNPNTTGETTTTQSTSTLTEVVTNTTALAENVLYTITPTSTANSCVGTAQTFTLSVKAQPTITSANTATVCSGTPLALGLNSNIAGTTYTWLTSNNVNTTGESTTSQSGATINNTIVNSSAVAQNLTYTVTPTATGCIGATQNVVVTVNILPTVTASAAPSTICQTGTSNFTAGGANTYSWLPVTNLSSSISATPLYNAAGAGLFTYTVTGTNSTTGCSNTATTNITVNASPAIPTPTANTVCFGNTTNFTTSFVAGASYNWNFGDASTSTLQNPTHVYGAAGVYTATVTATVSGCTSLPGTVNATVFANPTMSGTLSSCVGSSSSLSGSATANATTPWTSSNTGVATVNSSGLVTGMTGGTSTITYMNTNGCTISNTFTVNALPTTPPITSNSPVCSGGTLNLTTPAIATTYSWSGPNAFTANTQNANIPAVTVAGSGTYSLSVTNAAGCISAVSTSVVTINATPATPTITNNSPVCAGATLNLTTPAIATTYSWSGPNSFTANTQNTNIPSVTVAGSGTYSLTVASAAGCVSAIGTSAVTINATPATPTIVTNSPLCSGGSLNLSTPAIATSYNWSGPNAFTANTQNANIPVTTAAASGTYSLSVTNAAGCVSAIGTSAVTINATPSISTGANPNYFVCSGSSATFTSSPSGGSPTYTFGWYNVPTGGTSISSIQNFSILEAVGTYTYYTDVTDLNGCTSKRDTVNLTVQNPPSTAVAGTDINLCNNGSGIFSANTPTFGLGTWTVVSGTGTVTSPNSPASSFTGVALGSSTTFRWTIANGVCPSNTDDIVVTNNPTPIVTSSGPSNACVGTNVGLAASSATGTSYSWTGPNGFTSNLQNPTLTNVLPINSGNYSVITSDANGCSSIASIVNLTVDPIPNFTILAPSTICSGYPLNLGLNSLIGGSTFTFNWSGPNTFGSILQNPIRNNIGLLDGGNYTIQVTNEFGCTKIDIAAINVIPSPTANITGGPNTICANQFAALTGSTSTANGDVISSYQWIHATTAIPGATLVNYAANLQGIYHLQVINANGCKDTSLPFLINTNLIPSSVISGVTTFCSGSSTSLDGSSSIAGGASTISNYEWLFNGTSISFGSNFIASAGGNYQLVITNSNSCSDTSTITVVTTIPSPAPSITFGSQNICPNNTSGIAVTAPGGGSTFTWNTSAGLIIANPSAASTTYSGNTPGTYTLSVTETNTGCVGVSATETVTVFALPIASAVPPVPSTICNGGSITLSQNTVANAVSYSWLSSIGQTASNQNPTFTNITNTGVVSFYASVTDINGCVSLNDTISINVQAPLTTPTISNASSVCLGQAFTLNVSPVILGADYYWTDPSATTQNGINLTSITIPTANAVSAGPYVVNYIDPFGCTSASSSLYNQPIDPAPIVSISGTATICSGGGSTILSASTSIGTASAYQWYQNGSPIAGANAATYNATSIGNYNVQIILGTGCLDTAATPTTITATTGPIVSITQSTDTICEGLVSNLTANGASTYSWNFGSTNASVGVSPTAGTTTLYIVTGTDVNGCTAKDSVYVTTLAKPLIPTITPSATNVCAGTSVTLTSSNAVNNNWISYSPVTALSSAVSLTHTETVANTYTYGLFVIGTNGCSSDTAQSSITFSSCLTTLIAEHDVTTSNTAITNNIFTNDAGAPGYVANTSAIAAPTNGSVVISSNGNYTYTPTNNFSGYDMFIIQACNAFPTCLNDTIFIVVNPAINGDTYTVDGLSTSPTVIGNVLLNDAGSGLVGHVSLVNTATNGIIVIDTLGNFTYTPNAGFCGTDLFTYSVSDQSGLSANAGVNIIVTCDSTVTTTTGFSPNGDGVNDNWVIQGIEYTQNTVTIFDRWGNQVMSFTNYNNQSTSWNGKNSNGVELPAGTYFYSINIQNETPKKGWVEITK